MPTYVCSFPHGLLTGTTRVRIAKAIATRHAEATGAPAFFVQVVIDENPNRTRFLGGSPSDEHVWIRADIRAGRAEAVRQSLMLKIMEDISAITGIAAQNVWVYINNLEPTDMVEFGHVLPRPGEEQQWFERLPAQLQAYLSSLGTSSDTFTL